MDLLRAYDRFRARSSSVSLTLLALSFGSACSSDGSGVAAAAPSATPAPTAPAVRGDTSDVTTVGAAPATGGAMASGVTASPVSDESGPVVGSRVDPPAPEGVGEVAAEESARDAGPDAAPEAPAPAEPPPAPEPSVYNPCPPSGTDCTIMPLGDSITDGFTVRGGYRIPFFQGAHREGQQFTFVGSQVNGPATVDGVPFPQRHEGHSAHTMFDAPNAPIPRIGISNYIPQVIPRFQPDIVLLMIGTNDVDGNVDLPNAPQRLGTLIDSIIELDAHSLIVVAQITPTMQDPLNERIRTFNAGIPAVVKSRADAGKHVLLVDMYDAFANDPQFKAKFLADRLHPNSAGYQVMSDVWNSVVHDLLH